MKTSRVSKNPTVQAPRLLQTVARALDQKKAEDLRILDVRAQSSITDFLVLATGTSEPHLRALRQELGRVFEDAKAPIAGVENTEGSGWAVFDAYEIMVHLFTAESRARYRLEFLWKDAVDVPVPKLLVRSGLVKTTKARAAKRKPAS